MSNSRTQDRHKSKQLRCRIPASLQRRWHGKNTGTYLTAATRLLSPDILVTLDQRLRRALPLIGIHASPGATRDRALRLLRSLLADNEDRAEFVVRVPADVHAAWSKLNRNARRNALVLLIRMTWRGVHVTTLPRLINELTGRLGDGAEIQANYAASKLSSLLP